MRDGGKGGKVRFRLLHSMPKSDLGYAYRHSDIGHNRLNLLRFISCLPSPPISLYVDLGPGVWEGCIEQAETGRDEVMRVRVVGLQGHICLLQFNREDPVRTVCRNWTCHSMADGWALRLSTEIWEYFSMVHSHRIINELVIRHLSYVLMP